MVPVVPVAPVAAGVVPVVAVLVPVAVLEAPVLAAVVLAESAAEDWEALEILLGVVELDRAPAATLGHLSAALLRPIKVVGITPVARAAANLPALPARRLRVLTLSPSERC